MPVPASYWSVPKIRPSPRSPHRRASLPPLVSSNGVPALLTGWPPAALYVFGPSGYTFWGSHSFDRGRPRAPLAGRSGRRPSIPACMQERRVPPGGRLNESKESPMRVANVDGRLKLIVPGGAVDVERASNSRFSSDPQAAYTRFDELRTW